MTNTYTVRTINQTEGNYTYHIVGKFVESANNWVAFSETFEDLQAAQTYADELNAVKEEAKAERKTFRQVIEEITAGSTWGYQNKKVEKLLGSEAAEVEFCEGHQEWTIKSATYMKKQHGRMQQGIDWVRVRRAGETLKNKLGTEFVVTM
jgi:hypothetical protein